MKEDLDIIEYRSDITGLWIRMVLKVVSLLIISVCVGFAVRMYFSFISPMITSAFVAALAMIGLNYLIKNYNPNKWNKIFEVDNKSKTLSITNFNENNRFREVLDNLERRIPFE